LAAPLIHRLIDLIHDVEDGRRAQDWALLDLLGETVRA
jgi:hypothetical protein